MSEEQRIYVGPDWMAYAGPGAYGAARSLAPSLLMAPRGQELLLDHAAGEVRGRAVLHAMGHVSRSDGAEILVVYLDPVSDGGRVLQGLSAGPGIVALPEPVWAALSDLSLTALIRSRQTPAAARRMVAELTVALTALAPPPRLDARVRRILEAARTADAALRPAEAAARAGLSPDYARKLFRRETGTSLTALRAWRRLHALFAVLAGAGGRLTPTALAGAFHQAGFYDESHGAKAFDLFFGGKRPMMALPTEVIDCR